MNITYLLGAGASAECLPTYKNFQERFAQFGKYLESVTNAPLISETLKTDLKSILDIFQMINKEFAFHNTPDTIAKKYFHLNQSNLGFLKNILILYFLFEQTGNKELYAAQQHEIQLIDKRYDALIAALLKPIPQKIEFLKNFHILTWNYDLQFEISFAQYVDQTITNIQRIIQSYPKIIHDNLDFDKESFSIIHLNRIAYGRPDKFHRNQDKIGTINKLDRDFAEYLSEVFHAMHTVNPMHEVGGNRLLSFAWENIKLDNSLKENDVINNAIIVAAETEILVINGYSFPVFNRAIDKKIFESMKNLQKVYIQSPQAKNIESVITSDLKADVICVDVGYWNQFHIPNEWSFPRKTEA